MSAPFFSVFISTRNAQAFIAKCIASLRSQSFGDWEAIFIDDASTDATWERALEAIDSDPNIVPVRNAVRVRQVGAFLQALPLMRGEVIVELDGDDWFTGTRSLNLIRECYDDPECDGTASWNVSTGGHDSRRFADPGRDARFIDTYLSCCAPRSWRRAITLRALAELPQVFTDPTTGTPWASAGDLALFAPVLYYARKIGATASPAYVVNLGNPASDWVVEPDMQRDVAERLRIMWHQIVIAKEWSQICQKTP